MYAECGLAKSDGNVLALISENHTGVLCVRACVRGERVMRGSCYKVLVRLHAHYLHLYFTFDYNNQFGAE